jgi:hypothetical protein
VRYYHTRLFRQIWRTRLNPKRLFDQPNKRRIQQKAPNHNPTTWKTINCLATGNYSPTAPLVNTQIPVIVGQRRRLWHAGCFLGKVRRWMRQSEEEAASQKSEAYPSFFKQVLPPERRASRLRRATCVVRVSLGWLTERFNLKPDDARSNQFVTGASRL